MHRLFRFFLFFSLRRFFSSDAGHAINPMPGFSKPAFRFIPRFFYFLYISSRFCHVYMILEFLFCFFFFRPCFTIDRMSVFGVSCIVYLLFGTGGRFLISALYIHLLLMGCYGFRGDAPRRGSFGEGA
jgi:hypothetical protein